MNYTLGRETQNLESNTPVALISDTWTWLQETLSRLIPKINEGLDSTALGICELKCQAKL